MSADCELRLPAVHLVGQSRRPTRLTVRSASEIPDPTPAGPSAADIAKVVDEHKAKEAAREAKAKAKAAGGDAADKDKDKDKLDASSEKAKETTTSRPTTPSLSGIPSPSSTAAAKGKHKMYALHRSMFAMRVREHKQREQGVKAKEVGKGESPDYCNMCANGDL